MMSRLTKKIAAYTLTEMLVVLTLSTIVATLAFGILTLVNSNLNTIQNNYARSTEVNLLRQQLLIDFNRYNELTTSGYPKQLMGRTPLDSTQYVFTEKEILRNDDTLFSGDFRLSVFNHGKQVSNGTTDALKLEFGNPVTETIFLYKEKDAHQKLKYRGN